MSTASSSSNQLQRLLTNGEEEGNQDDPIREIHALTPPDHHPPSRPTHRSRPRDASWSSQSTAASDGVASSGENFTTISREFNALVIAGSALDTDTAADREGENGGGGSTSNLARIGEYEDQAPPEEEEEEMMNPLAIVPDRSYTGLDPGSSRVGSVGRTQGGTATVPAEASVQNVKKEEVETKIMAWQTAKIAKINNRFKREDAVINGWEGERVQKANMFMKKVERKLEEKRARAMEKMQNDVAKARRKAEERRASAEAKRGTKVARVLELANLMRAVGRPPVKRSFF